jgi:energy-coupling factor transporter ATP-binding protein EcfA2
LYEADVVTPRGEAIATNLSFSVRPGKSLMIVGRGGSGKSSCVRALRGLWTLPRGRRAVPGDSLRDLVVVPQRIHMVLGTLADQVSYPLFIAREERTEALEKQLLSLLDLVGIGYLVDRWGGDAEADESHKGTSLSRLSGPPLVGPLPLSPDSQCLFCVVSIHRLGPRCEVGRRLKLGGAAENGKKQLSCALYCN